jgi:hypothetical protein
LREQKKKIRALRRAITASADCMNVGGARDARRKRTENEAASDISAAAAAAAAAAAVTRLVSPLSRLSIAGKFINAADTVDVCRMQRVTLRHKR